MYTIANCTCTILRRQAGVDTLGDPNGQYVAIKTGVTAAILETGSRTFDYSTRTPRQIRTITGQVPAGSDVQTGDRIRDDRFGVTYVVDNTTLVRAAGHQPDLMLDLKKVSG